MFYAGLDLGQRRDHTAIVVVERKEIARGFDPPEFSALLVRHIERAPLGTPYPKVVERVRKIVGHRELAGRCSLTVDGTGVGLPVVEMLRAARVGCEINAVTITGGGRESSYQAAGGTAWNVPKQDLMAGVQVLLEKGELRIAKSLKETRQLVKELQDVKATPRSSGQMRIGADGEGQHDDLVIALALACWCARRRRRIGFGNQRLPVM